MSITITTIGGVTPRITYTYVAVPAINSISPNSGTTLGGTGVTISGTDLSGATAVTFGGTPAQSFTVVSSTQITAVTPAGSAGVADVKVVTPGGTATLAGAYSYIPPAPTLSGLSPNSGTTLGGTLVTITGANFTGATGVRFGNTNAITFAVVNDSAISATAPPGSAGEVNVFVTTFGGTSAAGSIHYTYIAPPVISGLSLNGGSTLGGTSVIITGTNFTGATSVTFGGTAASFTVNSATQITATTPAHAAGRVDVDITTAGGTATGAGLYTFAVPGPTISSISPNSGPASGGTNVTISGTNFTGATAVTFGSQNATSFTVVDGSTINATAPAGSAGTVDVLVTTAGGTTPTGAATRYAYSAPPAPTITSVNPTIVPENSVFTFGIVGTNLTGATVTFDGTRTTLTFTSETGLRGQTLTPHAAGTGTLLVTTPGGSASFIITVQAAPFISSLRPSQGPSTGGNTVTVTGTGLANGTITVTGGGPNVNVPFTATSDTEGTFVAPAHASGTPTIFLTTQGGSSDGFTYTYTAPATITGITPDNGTTLGGTTVTISGTNLLHTTSVTFGGVSAVISSTSPGSILLKTPPGSAGAADVEVTTDQGTASTTFTYVTPAPTISSVSPNSGSALGGDRVVISGADLAGATAVTFGGAAASFVVNSSTQITATTPNHAVGPVDVGVTTPAGTASEANAFTFHQVATTVGLASSANPAMLNQSVTLTAKVSPSNATGTITFADSGTPLCSAVAVAGGVVECVTRFTTGGPHPITAAFLGTGAFANSTSPTLTEDVTDQVTKTVQTIGKFLSQRTNQILSNEPNASRQIDRLQEAAGAVPQTGDPASSTTAMLTPPPSRFGDGISGNDFSRMALGAQGNSNRRLANNLPMSSQDGTSSQGSLPVAMNGSDDGPLHLGFSTSLHDMQHAAQAASQNKEGLGGVSPLSQPAFNPWDVWFEGTYSRFNDDATRSDLSGHFGLFTGGVDYVVNSSLLVGVLVQVDTMTQKSTADQASASGTGWMAGPYATVRLSKQLFWQVRAAWGTSNNDVSPFLTYSDSFDTTRWLASTKLTGDWDFGPWSLRPTASVAYMEDNSDSYNDHFGASIPGVHNRLGQATLGPEIDYRFASPGGGTIEPHATVQAIWNFAGSTSAEGLGSIDGADAGPEGVRARAELGLRMATPSGLGLDISASYDGIGASGYDDVAGHAAVTVPFR